MNKDKRLEIFKRLAEAIPEPVTELNYNSTFELLIAVVLSAQATDKGVNKATAKLFPIANTPQAIFDLGEEGLKVYIKPSAYLIAKAQILLNFAVNCWMIFREKYRKHARN